MHAHMPASHAELADQIGHRIHDKVRLTLELLADLSFAEVIFATVGGLRGAISLILAQMVVTEQAPEHHPNKRVTAEACPRTLTGCIWSQLRLHL